MKFTLLCLLVLTQSCSMLRKDRTAEYEALKFNKEDRTVSSAVNTDEFISKFKETMCPQNVDLECAQKYEQMIHSRLEQRYFGASPVAVKKTCNSYPVECRNESFLEGLYINLHNRTVDLFKTYNEKWGEDDLMTEWKRFNTNSPRLPAQEIIVHESRPVIQQPQQNFQPSAPTQYNTQCRTYSWGTDCNTTGR